jgi:hypothetical protein
MSEMFTVELPSRGVLYEDKLPGGKVNLRPMGEAEENLLFQRGGDAVMKAHRIVDNCYLDAAKVAPGDLLMIDGFYILLMLRVQMFGPVYEVPFRCQACSHQRKTRVNILEELDKRDMADGVVEPFEVVLAHAKKTVNFRLLRRKDEEDVSKHTKRMLMKSTDFGDDSARYRIGKQIMSIDGKEVGGEEAQRFARALDMKDANDFRLAVEAVEGGVDLTLYQDCPACGYANEYTMPFTAEFFRPSNR